MQDRIDAALVAAFLPQFFEIEDESAMHHVGAESHYKVVVVSDAFEGLSPVKRHQKVYAAMGDIMQQIHALSIHAYSPSEWREKGLASVHESPFCEGGGLLDLKQE